MLYCAPAVAAVSKIINDCVRKKSCSPAPLIQSLHRKYVCWAKFSSHYKQDPDKIESTLTVG